MTNTISLEPSSGWADRQLRIFTQSAAFAVLAVGALVLTGWALDVGALKSVLPGFASMKANTAIGLMLAGAALWLLADESAAQWRRRAGLGCAVIVTLLGLLTLSQYFFGLVGMDFGIDQMLFREAPGAVLTGQPGRMGPNTALCFVLSGGALLLLGVRSRVPAWLAQGLTLAALVIALMALIGYAYSVPYLSRLASATSMALHAALAFVALSVGLMAARPRRPLMALLTSKSPGGILLRRVWPQAILLFVLLGWLELMSTRAGWYETDFGTALLVLTGLTLFSLLILGTARALERLDAEHKLAEIALHRQSLLINLSFEPICVWDLEKGIVEWNAGAEQLYGHTKAEASGRNSHELLKTVHPLPLKEFLAALERDGEWTGELRDRAKDGREVIIESRQQLIELNGRRLVMETSRDITERKRRELNLAFLAEISQDLLGITVDTVMQTVGAKIGAYLQLSACTLMEINEAADEAIVTHEWHRADRPSLAGKYHISDFVRDDFHRASRAGETFIVRDTAADPRTNADEYAAIQVGSYVSVPIIRNNEWQFLLVLFDDKARNWRNDEIELMQELTTRIWIRLERARATEQLRESEARLNAILQNMNSVIYMLDAENRFVHVNRLWEELLNLKADEVRGKSVYDLFPAAIADKFAANNRRVMDTGKTIEFEETGLLADGEHIYHSVKVPRLDADGKACGIIGISTDITERKLVEATLHASEVKYRRLFETAQDGILILNFETANITNANSYIGELLGFSEAELMGKELWEIGLFKDMHENKAAVRELQASKYIRYDDLPLKTKAGHRVDVEFVSNVYRENGHSVIQCNIRDITERKRAEAERARLLTEAQRLRGLAETANRIKDEFLATISHELRTPLNHMLGWVVMLRGGQLAPEKAAEALETVERNVRAQNRLVEDLLDVSRIVTGKMQLLVQPVVMAQVVEAAIISARPAAEAKNIRLQVVLDSRVSTVSGDPDRLQQVVWNLISNAIKFTPKGGRVQIRLDRLNSHVEITVSDTGDGLAPEFLPFVFDRFSQADASMKRNHSGLGLGLAIVRHLVELHGGEVSATSPGLGQGATFTVILPLRIVDSGARDAAATVTSVQPVLPVLEDQSAPHPPSAVLKGVRVLVVDDEADSRLLLAAMLAVSEVDVRTAGSMDEALKTLDDWRPDVLISDIGMPNGDGYDLIREIRQRDAATGHWLPAMALTAYARLEDRMRAISAGYQMHVAKPVDPQELLTVIASLAGRLPHSE